MKRIILAYLGKLQGNSKVCIAFLAPWAIPYSIYFFYLSVYLKARGVTDSQLGTLMMVGSLAALVFSVVSAPIVDRFGRKLTTLVFDLISSVLPTLVFLISGSFPFALMGMVLANMNRIMSLAYYLLMIEDSTDETSVVAVNTFNIIIVAAGLLTPLAGLVVGALGIVRAEQLFLAISAVSMTTLAIARHAMLRETSIGKRIMEEHKRLRETESIPGTYRLRLQLKRSFAPYAEAIGFLRGDMVAARALTANVLFYTYYAIGTSASLYFAPYFIDFLQLTGKEVAYIGGVYAIGTLIAMVFINPLLNRSTLNRFLIIACCISLVGFTGLVLSPKGNLALALCATFIIAVAYGMLKTTADALIALHTSGESRTGIYALSYLASSVLGVIVIKVCSLLYTRYPGWLFILSGLLVLLILLSQLPRRGRR